MALSKLGGGIIEINGKSGGNIYRRDQCGQHVQKYPRLVGTKSPTEAQKLQRACFMDCVYIWSRDVTDKQILQWYQYAALHWKTNKKGEPIQLSGWNMFLRINLIRIRNGLTALREPPTD